MTFDFHPEAEEEFVEAVSYYESCDIGLGVDFAREIHTAIRNAVEYPALGTEMETGIRRSLVHRFSFGILYSIQPDRIFILAVMHLHREPDYWKQRIKT